VTQDGPRHLLPVAAFGLLAILWSQFAWVRLGNFGGYDEWLLLSLTSQGIIDSPYSNRPFNFLFTLPGAWLTPHSFTGYSVVHAAYIWLWGVCVFWTLHRLLPAQGLLAFLAGAFSVVWMPVDLVRLSAVQGTFYSGFTLCMLVATLLYAESWLRQSALLLVSASVLAYITIRGYEAAAPFLFFVPALVLWRRAGAAKERAGWILLWGAAVSVALVQALWPMIFPTGGPTYQNSVWSGGPNLSVPSVLARVGRQCLLHLIPLVRVTWSDFPGLAAPLSVLVFALCFRLVSSRFAGGMPPPRSVGAPLGFAGAGLVFAGLGYSALVVGGADASATRMQFYSAPGMALLLAGLVGFIGMAVPLKARVLVMGALSAWIVLVGCGRTLVMQQGWDGYDKQSRQRSSLRQFVALAPDLRPGTLIILIDPAGVWPATFGFRHAVEYLYPNHATGLVWNANDLLYPTTFDEIGIRTVPWASIQRPWGVRPRLHHYDQVAAFRLDAESKLERLDVWPPELPALPGGASYGPAVLVTLLAKPLPVRDILR
jgi:hypothetical protein